jgi:hypothetical protein
VQPLRTVWPASATALGIGVVSEVIALVLFANHSSERAPEPAWSPAALLLAPTPQGMRF